MAKQLVSVRMDEMSIWRLDELAKRHSYWSRSYIIDQIVGHVLNDANEATIFEMLKHRYFETSNDKVTYTH